MSLHFLPGSVTEPDPRAHAEDCGAHQCSPERRQSRLSKYWHPPKEWRKPRLHVQILFLNKNSSKRLSWLSPSILLLRDKPWFLTCTSQSRGQYTCLYKCTNIELLRIFCMEERTEIFCTCPKPCST